MPVFTTLASFDGSDGSDPVGKLVADSEGNLFGVTASGGLDDHGVVFELEKADNGYASAPIVLADLGGSTGVDPSAGLVIDPAGDLFGTTTSGGADDTGTIFELTKSGGSYENVPTVLANGAPAPIAGLAADGNGDLFELAASEVFELAKSGPLYASALTSIVSFPAAGTLRVASLTVDTAGNVYGLETEDLGFGAFNQNVFETTKSGSTYTSTILQQIVAAQHAGGPSPEISSIYIDQSGDIFGTYQGYTLTSNILNPYTYNGYVFEIANTPSGLSDSATALATFSGMGGSGLSEDSRGDLYGVWDDEIFEIVKDNAGYDSTPRTLALINGPDGPDTTGIEGYGLIALGAAALFGVGADGGADDDGAIYELNLETAPSLKINSTVGQADPTQQTIGGKIDLADVGQQISIYDGSTLIGTATPSANGYWSATVSLAATVNSQSITAQATNTTNGANAIGVSNTVAYTLNSAASPSSSRLSLITGGGLDVGSGDGDVRLFDLSGNDTLQGGAGDEALHVTTGDNSMVAGSGLNTLFGGAGDDTLIGGGRSRLVGGSGIQRLIGGGASTASDTLIGGGGTDTLSVSMGNNMLIAGGGASTLRGGSGQDTLKGGSGLAAVLIAGSGAQRLVGGTLPGSSDTLHGGAGTDTLVSIAGNDRLLAGSGDDALRGGSGFDTMVAGTGRDRIYGGPGDDRVLLESGGQAVVYAGAGNNKVLVGATGNDSVFGGSGVTNVYTAQADSQVSNEYVNAAQYLEVTFTDGQVLTLEGVTLHFQGGGVIQS